MLLNLLLSARFNSILKLSLLLKISAYLNDIETNE